MKKISIRTKLLGVIVGLTFFALLTISAAFLLIFRDHVAEESSTAAFITIVSVIAITLLLSLFISYLLIKRIIEPLNKLTQLTKQIGEGNLNVQIPKTEHQDEIGTLTNTIHWMLERLRYMYAQIEQLVKVRTNELKEKVEEVEFKNRQLEETKAKMLTLLRDLEKEQRLAELSVGESKKFKLAVQYATDAVVIVDATQKIIYSNGALEKMSGYTSKEVFGRSIEELFISPDTDREIVNKINEIFHTGESLQTDNFKLNRKHGEALEVDLSVFPIQNNTGHPEFMVALMQDITQRKAIDRAKTEFVSLASHQLRTPLSTIKWYIEMLLNGDVGEIKPEQREYLEQVYQSNDRMITLVNALLDVSRLELGTFIVEPEDTDLVALLKSIIKEMEHKIQEKKISFNLQNDDLPQIKVDPRLMNIVLLNLLTNAVKYTLEGGKVEVALVKVNKGGSVGGRIMQDDTVLYKVSDTGIGIPRDQQEKIFTKLYRADNVKEYEVEGTGLGLYILKSIVEHSGGQVWFESEEKKGSTFYVTFPLSGMKPKEGTRQLGA